MTLAFLVAAHPARCVQILPGEVRYTEAELKACASERSNELVKECLKFEENKLKAFDSELLETANLDAKRKTQIATAAANEAIQLLEQAIKELKDGKERDSGKIYNKAQKYRFAVHLDWDSVDPDLIKKMEELNDKYFKAVVAK
ncbi:MAG: hypothetical protein LBB23_03665 [Rickettsiales bacterium]|nr:hypothetical protein [Rickettsiales bacterium]